jgi:hypothetical protein
VIDVLLGEREQPLGFVGLAVGEHPVADLVVGIARRSSSVRRWILATSCDVLKPSKKWMNGIRDASVAACETSARSCAFWTELEHSMAQPVIRAAITSE